MTARPRPGARRRGAAGAGHRRAGTPPPPGSRDDRRRARGPRRDLEGDAVEDREQPDVVQPDDARPAGRRARRAGDRAVPGCGRRRPRGGVHPGRRGRADRRPGQQGRPRVRAARTGGGGRGPRARPDNPPCYPASSLRKLRGPHKRMEAHLVTLTERSEVFPLFQHTGTELLFMLEGEMVYGHGEATYTLGPGDALQLDGEGVHGPQELLDAADPVPVGGGLRRRAGIVPAALPSQSGARNERNPGPPLDGPHPHGTGSRHHRRQPPESSVVGRTSCPSQQR